MPRFKVHSKLGRPFRRNGVKFDVEPQVVDSEELEWTEDQMKEFLSAETAKALFIEALEPPEDKPDIEPLHKKSKKGR